MSTRRAAGALSPAICLLMLTCSGSPRPVAPTLRLTPLAPAVSPAASPRPLAASGTPEPAFPLVGLPSGREIHVWVSNQASESTSTCGDLLPDMLPVSATDDPAGKAVACTVGVGEIGRLLYRQSPNDLFYLDRVDILVPLSDDPTTTQKPPWTCHAMAAFLLPATGDPSTARFRGVCAIEAPVRSKAGPDAIRIWASMRIWEGMSEQPTVPSFAPDVLCWQLAPYLGPATEAESFNLPCVLN